MAKRMTYRLASVLLCFVIQSTFLDHLKLFKELFQHLENKLEEVAQ